MRFRMSFLVILCCACLLRCGNYTWVTLSTSNQSHASPYLSVHFFNREEGLALTANGLLRTVDGGRDWTTLYSGKDEESFNAFTFTSDRDGFIVGTRQMGTTPIILRTHDRGLSWGDSFLKLPPTAKASFSPRLQSISFCGKNSGWAAGSDLILHTTDGGESWESQRTVVGDGLFGVACWDENNAVAVGRHGLILRTADAGKNWSTTRSGTEEPLLRVRVFGQVAWILGGASESSVLLRSDDRGITWQSKDTHATHALFDIYMTENLGWIVGATGTLLHTTDGGNTWTQEQSLTTNDLTAVFFLDNATGWIGGDKLTLLQYKAE